MPILHEHEAATPNFQQKISHENFLHEIFIDGRVVAKAYAMHLYVIIIR